MSTVGRAFDQAATGYDAVAESHLGRQLRARVHEHLERLLTPGATVLDIGCGIGHDAAWLLDQGHEVTAVDASPEMVQQARHRTGGGADVRCLDIDDGLGEFADSHFDLVLADFGVLNCINDVPALGRNLARLLRPNGYLVAVTMGRFCPWETATGLLGGRPGLATRRWAGPVTAYADDLPLPVEYHSPKALAGRLGDLFRVEHVEALGSVLPTYELRAVLDSRVRLARVLAGLDRAVSQPAGKLGVGDHHLVIMRTGPSVGSWARAYAQVRHAEGRYSSDSGYYRALPYPDRSSPRHAEWRHRAASFEHAAALIAREATGCERQLLVADLGAGNCWMSARLARQGHEVIAIDVNDDAGDGLRAHTHYEENFTVARGEFDRLPLASHVVDVAVFNASFHYAQDHAAALTEVARVLRPGGLCLIVDSPVYHHRRSGQRMVRDQQRQLSREYGGAAPQRGAGFIHASALLATARRVGLQISPAAVRGSFTSLPARALSAARLGREPGQLLTIALNRPQDGSP